MLRKIQDVSMVFPGSATVAPLFVTFEPHLDVNTISVAPASALPTGATIKVGVLKQAGDPTSLADYNVIKSLTGGDTVTVAGGHIAVWGLSAGTGGTVVVTVAGGRVGGK